MTSSPGIPLNTYRLRRRRLMRALKGGVAILPTSLERVRNADTHYPYRWDSHFHYLTGFEEPEAVLVLVGGRHSRSILFCRPRDQERELWEGIRLGPKAAPTRLGVDEAHSIERLDDCIVALLSDVPMVYTFMGEDRRWDERVTGWLARVRSHARSGVMAPSAIHDVRAILDEMRLVKDSHELRIMRHAARISATAHRRAMQVTRPGRHEYEIEAELLHEFCAQGARFPAYPSIVAGGRNGCILHYVENRSLLAEGDLLLIDAGCEYQGYASDITRTFPVNGKFTQAQQDLYEVVLAAQEAAIAAVAPGKPFQVYHEAALKVLVRGLIDLKLCRGTVSGVLESGEYRRFYMHRTGHWLGMDVHDVGAYRVEGRSRPLIPGMVLTVEPGLYVRPGKDVPKAFHHMGIRIEDDVVVTRQGREVLTGSAPKTVRDIEACMETLR